MKFDFFKNKNRKTGSDCECGCLDNARESVRLTDAEIAEDIIRDLDSVMRDYSCLCDDGCDCEEKLCSCEKTKQCLCDYLGNCCK